MTLNDQTFLKRFAMRDLGPEFFDHRGHLRMAWIHLNHYPLEQAIQLVCAGIKDLAIKFGAPDKFNHTLSEALMRLMYKRMQAVPNQDFANFLTLNPDLMHDAQGLLGRHYSAACLGSDHARQAWVAPDLSPIDDLN